MTARKNSNLDRFAAEMEAYMNACACVDQFCGAVLVNLQGQTLLRRAYGLADFEHRVANSVQTKFRLGSITKPITAMAIYMLEEARELSVNDHVGKYITDAPHHWHNITIKHLLDHRSGLPNFTEFPDNVPTQRLPSSPWQTMERFRNLALVTFPGSVSRYSDSGYIVLGVLIELISGKSYTDFLSERIFRPLKMNDTGYDSAEAIIANRARGYVQMKQAVQNANYLDMSIPFAAGALYSTIDDLRLLDEAITQEQNLIPREVIKTMNSPMADSYSAGWRLEKAGRYRVGHSGGIDGFCTVMTRFPYDKLCIAVLSNLVSWQYSPERISHDLSAIIFSEPYQIPQNRQVISLDSPQYDH